MKMKVNSEYIKRILLICTGNTCRSQMAEGILKNTNANLQVFSAGTKPEDKVNPIAIKVMQELGIDISNNIPKSVNNFKAEDFDYVITLCDNAKSICPDLTGLVKNNVHAKFEDPACAIGNMEEKLEVYRNIRDKINVYFRDFIKEIQN